MSTENLSASLSALSLGLGREVVMSRPKQERDEEGNFMPGQYYGATEVYLTGTSARLLISGKAAGSLRRAEGTGRSAAWPARQLPPFASRCPKSMPMAIKYAATINGAAWPAVGLVSRGDFTMFGGELCWGCGAALAVTGGVHKRDEQGNVCGKAIMQEDRRK